MANAQDTGLFYTKKTSRRKATIMLGVFGSLVCEMIKTGITDSVSTAHLSGRAFRGE